MEVILRSLLSLRTLFAVVSVLCVLAYLNCRVTNRYRFSWQHGWQIIKDGSYVQGWPLTFVYWPMPLTGDSDERIRVVDWPASVLNCLIAALIAAVVAYLERCVTRSFARRAARKNCNAR